MFERFTEQARQVIVLAHEEARILKHNHISTEHVLLGLLREKGGIAARVLEHFGLTTERTREHVVEIAEPGGEFKSGQVPFTPGAKRVLERALREALVLGHNYIGPEHILLGLVREKDDAAARVLLDLNADAESVRQEVMRLLSGGGPAGGEPTLERVGLSDALLDGAGPVLRRLVDEIEEQLGRPADAGDLLVLLASVPGGIVERSLGSLRIDTNVLRGAVEDMRRGGERSSLLPPRETFAECDQLRAERVAALRAQRYERARELQAQERELLQRALEPVELRQDELLAGMRERLGLADP